MLIYVKETNKIMNTKESIKVKVFEILIDKTENLFIQNLKSALTELASILDNEDNSERRLLDKYYDKETSIWFDSFDNYSICNNIDYICFLMAKDVNYMLTEDSETQEIKHFKSDKIRPKVPAHCVYVKQKNLILIEQIANAPTEATLKRGLSKNLNLKQSFLEFKPVYRKDIIKRLQAFVNTISNIEIDTNSELVELTNHLNDDDGFLQNLVSNPNTKVNISLNLESDDSRQKVVNFFSRAFENGKIREFIKNIKISHLNENDENEITKLVENLLFLSLEKEVIHQNILEVDDRVEYSKNKYLAMIKSYETHFKN